jgi:hypothetical protein
MPTRRARRRRRLYDRDPKITAPAQLQHGLSAQKFARFELDRADGLLNPIDLAVAVRVGMWKGDSQLGSHISVPLVAFRDRAAEQLFECRAWYQQPPPNPDHWQFARASGRECQRAADPEDFGGLLD